MKAFRSALFVFLLVITVAPWSILCVLCAVLPLHVRYRITVMWPRFVIRLATWLLGIRWQMTGIENLPDGPAILLSKHQSTWETLFYVSHMPREVCFVFKREILYLPFFGWGIGLLNMIHINRQKGVDAFEQVVAQGSQKLSEGRWVIMFPEGTRIPSGKAGRYKSGGARLAVRTGAPVVPIAVNSGNCWPKKPFVKSSGLITVAIGPPIATQGCEADEVITKVRTWIEEQMRVISPQDYAQEAR